MIQTYHFFETLLFLILEMTFPFSSPAASESWSPSWCVWWLGRLQIPEDIVAPRMVGRSLLEFIKKAMTLISNQVIVCIDMFKNIQKRN
jgi:hypothetical protein